MRTVYFLVSYNGVPDSDNRNRLDSDRQRRRGRKKKVKSFRLRKKLGRETEPPDSDDRDFDYGNDEERDEADSWTKIQSRKKRKTKKMKGTCGRNFDDSGDLPSSGFEEGYDSARYDELELEYDDEKSDCRQKRKVEQKMMVIRPFKDSFARAADYGTYRLLKKRVEYATIAKLIPRYWKKYDVQMRNCLFFCRQSIIFLEFLAKFRDNSNISKIPEPAALWRFHLYVTGQAESLLLTSLTETSPWSMVISMRWCIVIQ